MCVFVSVWYKHICQGFLKLTAAQRTAYVLAYVNNKNNALHTNRIQMANRTKNHGHIDSCMHMMTGEHIHVPYTILDNVKYLFQVKNNGWNHNSQPENRETERKNGPLECDDLDRVCISVTIPQFYN